MNALWCDDGSGWVLKGPTGFPDEKTLHRLVEEAPQLLPLAGAPTLVVLGTEVRCGSGYADVVAMEASGRPVLIEVKLAANAEARRAVVAQLLAYAASLHGLTEEEFEGDVLAPHLQRRGFASIADAVASAVQDLSFEAAAFKGSLAESLEAGRFRLVFVLDEAPEELVRLVGYLETVTDVLAIDLITVTLYEVAGARVVVPQRVSPERPAREAGLSPAPKGGKVGPYIRGPRVFLDSIETAPLEHQAGIRRLADWAMELERRGFATLYSATGTTTRLLPWVRGYDAGIITVFNDRKGVGLWFWPSVCEKRAPQSLEPLKVALNWPEKGAPAIREIDDHLLALLTRAYEQATNGHVS